MQTTQLQNLFLNWEVQLSSWYILNPKAAQFENEQHFNK
jgi:hypothetical protein